MKITIDGKVIPMTQAEKWKAKRIPKVLRTLKQKPFGIVNVEEAMKKLTDVKLRLSYEEMIGVLKPKLNLSAFVIRCAIALSGGKRKFAITNISLDGISAADISREIDVLMLEESPENNKVNLASCPDHYVVRATGNNALDVIETCGNSPLPFQFFIIYGDETGLQTPRDKAYQFQSAGVARLKNGKVMGGVRHQFKDTESGFEAKLVVEFPALCPTAIVKEHTMHLACEFSYWFQWIKDNKS